MCVPAQGRMQDLFWEGADFKKMGVRGLPNRKLITMDPLVNIIIVILVNFLHFVILFLPFSHFFSD